MTVLWFQGIGEPPVFFGSTVFFAIKAAVAEARRERGLGDIFPLSSPATAEKIRMTCQDKFTEMVRDRLRPKITNLDFNLSLILQAGFKHFGCLNTLLARLAVS